MYGAARPRWQEKRLSKERVSSAITEFMHVIDHKPNDLNEIKDSDITFETFEWLGASSS